VYTNDAAGSTAESSRLSLERKHVRAGAQPVEKVSPRLHHLPPLVEPLRAVVCVPNLVALGMPRTSMIVGMSDGTFNREWVIMHEPEYRVMPELRPEMAEFFRAGVPADVDEFCVHR
jgi:hypothetical protein